MKIISYSIILLSAMVISACSHKTTEIAVVGNGTQRAEQFVQPQRPVSTANKALLSHRVYKMTGDYADLVPVTLDNMGGFRSYPDPVDINDSQKPVALGDGWYLDRRGVNENTAFLDYTYEEYQKLPKVPSQETLKAHIKVCHGISQIWNCGTTRRTIDEYKKLVADGFPGCDCIVAPAPVK